MMSRFQFAGLIRLVKHPPKLPPCLSYRFLSSSSANKPTNDSEKASPAQLAHLEDKLVHHLPYIFNHPHLFDLYSKDIIFIDNIRKIKTQGLSQYALQVYLFKIYHNVRYMSAKLELLNLVKHPEESYIKIRWRIVTKPGLTRSVFSMFKNLQLINKLEKWNDGISTMHVNNKGKIYCHVCDKIDVDDADDMNLKAKQTLKNPLVNRGLNVHIKKSIVN